MLLMVAAFSVGVRQHSLSDSLQLAAILAVCPVFLYVMTGRLLAAQSPGGKLSWTGRRWQRGFGLAGALMSSVALIYLIGRAVQLAIIPLLALLGYAVILGVRWLWSDWKNEQCARDAELQALAQDGKKYSPPRLTGANKMWRWLLNGYAIVLIAALVYALIRYLVSPK